MASDDRDRWDERYRSKAAHAGQPDLPERFRPFADLLAASSTAIELACGSGELSVWLAARGVQVHGFDVSAVAIEQAKVLAEQHTVSDQCVFEVADLDNGLPPGPQVDLLVCNMFRDPALDQQIVDRLRPQGAVVIAALSEVGARPGRFRAKHGELVEAFAELDILGQAEGDGLAWLVARKPARLGGGSGRTLRRSAVG